MRLLCEAGKAYNSADSEGVKAAAAVDFLYRVRFRTNEYTYAKPFVLTNNFSDGAYAANFTTNPCFTLFVVAKTKFACLALAGDAVWRRGPDSGGAWVEQFRLPPLREGRRHSICADPASGDIFVGASYPEVTVRRYSRDGRERVDGQWPKIRIHSSHFAVVDSTVWALENGCRGLFPEQAKLGDDLPGIGGDWTDGCTGLARAPDGTWWLACRQGLIGFAPDRRPLGVRVGGLEAPALLAASPDGELIACDGGLMLRMGIDDAADAPLRSGSTTTFLVGFRYDTRAVGMASFGPSFLVLDGAKKRLWAFDPAHATDWRRPEVWRPLSGEGAFTQPVAVAAGGNLVFVADGGEALCCPHPVEDGAFERTGVKTDAGLAANDDGWLFTLEAGRVRGSFRERSGSFAPKWLSPERFDAKSGLAADGDAVVVADPVRQAVFLLAAGSGEVRAAFKAGDVAGGFEPTAVCARGPWVFVGDGRGRRILRLRIVPLNQQAQ